MAEVLLDDFTGGLREALDPQDFSDAQWAELKGVVLTPTGVRAQWACQRVGPAGAGLRMVRGLGSGSRYLIGLDANGGLWWMVRPDRTATASTTRALSWTQIPVTADSRRRFLCEVPVRNNYSGSGYRLGLLAHSREGGGPALLISEAPSGGPQVTELSDPWPAASGPDDELGVSGKMPRANTGVWWAGRLWLADVTGPLDIGATASATENARWQSGFWVSAPGDPTRFHPQFSFLVPENPGPEARVVALVPTYAGLLVVSTLSGEGSGVTLLRGTGLDDLRVEVLQGSTGAAAQGEPPYSTHVRWPTAVEWPEAQAVAYVDYRGDVWLITPDDARPVGRHGPALQGPADVLDQPAPLGPWLLVRRGSRLLAMRAFTEDGSWSELIQPAGGLRSLVAFDGCVYGVSESDGTVWRYTPFVPAEDGQIDGTPVQATVSTRTLSALPHRSAIWLRAGIRLSGTGTLDEVVVTGGPALNAASPKLVRPLSRALGARSWVMVRGFGPAREFSATFRITGGFEAEAVSVVVAGRKERR